ncbi:MULTISPECIES: hypothetical protein [Pseudomonas]|uniref:Uncharacterized protein n=1 Tax=Pseudomonas putida TaxID=303 RepID=A0AAP9SQV4_PSEPU|nr:MULTISPECIES: hypothetical protein [Pseudomonas]QJQ11335.1 hypothetical protein A3L25_018540 [Pseudomonas putida]
MSLTDRDLIEFAAIAIGATAHEPSFKGDIRKFTAVGFSGWFSPLDFKEQALILATKLRLDVEFLDGFKQVVCRRNEDKENFEMHGIVGYGQGTDLHPTSENVARAILIAAANIGMRMQEKH